MTPAAGHGRTRLPVASGDDSHPPSPPHREEEMPELESLSQSTAVPIEVRGGLASKEGKTNVLLQARMECGSHRFG